ncbi:hypothetical protein ONS95_010211 [Cadophora gregata]|uniref:uncharacterized protein n=1 Tax=Cadophora gregata TaxID=51156 RepID=UPI0026DC8CBA|nr:uncharacterized protein ONS95_010211 [Cadophora gregata]KAK0121937.1 hypothetical protein ONS95_010211 [Cadophora gregata]KAK0127417.1 hypothetical protein ONS96_006959 [Cadophora gregata f. sp. sojae]
MGSIDIELFTNGGWDTHHHIFDTSTFPYSPDRHLTPPQATIQEYESFKQSLGITKSVLTHGLSYGNDCSSLKSFIHTLGPDKTYGCAVIDEETPASELASLVKSGVRGIRLNLYGYNAMTDIELQVQVLQLYAQRVRQSGTGWFLEFLQINMANWAPLSKVIPKLGLQVVTDHHALLKAESMLPAGTDVLAQPGLVDIVALLKTGNFWLKLSAPYRSSTQAPYYEDMKPLVMALVEANPTRVLWGSDWPHTPNMKVRSKEEALNETPFQDIDDRAWLTSLRTWLSDDQWDRLMNKNPEELYGS